MKEKPFSTNYGKYISIIISMAILSIMLVIALITVSSADFSYSVSQAFDFGIEIFGMVLCLILLYSCVVEAKTERRTVTLVGLIVIIGISLFLNLIDGFFEGNPDYIFVIKGIRTLTYLNDDLIVCIFWHFIYVELEEKASKLKLMNLIINVIVISSIIATLLNVPFGFFFSVESDGIVMEYFWALLSILPALIIFLAILGCILYSKVSSREKLVLLSFEILPTVATIILLCGIKQSLVYPAYLLSVILIYIEFYERRRRIIANQQAELTKQSMALLISQIQPHFIYNTLTAISNMCVTDPKEAEETTVLFSQYLRGNLDSLSLVEPIPFTRELDHINIYLELEKKRFKDKLNIEMNINAKDFKVPALSLQPIVENSVKHGICKATKPGHLRISSYQVENGFLVVIEDDGVGFDTNAPLPKDGKNHVGISNVKNRLENMCQATMTIVSSPERGCRTEILFPAD